MKKMMNREETITVDLLRWSTDEEAQKLLTAFKEKGCISRVQEAKFLLTSSWPTFRLRAPNLESGAPSSVADGCWSSSRSSDCSWRPDVAGTES
jgi:hypothetical protein